MVFWAVSNCDTVIHREKYVKKLQKYMTVNIFTKVDHSLDSIFLIFNIYRKSKSDISIFLLSKHFAIFFNGGVADESCCEGGKCRVDIWCFNDSTDCYNTYICISMLKYLKDALQQRDKYRPHPAKARLHEWVLMCLLLVLYL